MQYQLLALKLASLYLQQDFLCCSTGNLSYSWHNCKYNSTSSDAVLVTFPKVGITVPTTAQALMQNRLFALELASLYQQ